MKTAKNLILLLTIMTITFNVFKKEEIKKDIYVAPEEIKKLAIR